LCGSQALSSDGVAEKRRRLLMQTLLPRWACIEHPYLRWARPFRCARTNYVAVNTTARRSGWSGFSCRHVSWRHVPLVRGSKYRTEVSPSVNSNKAASSECLKYLLKRSSYNFPKQWPVRTPDGSLCKKGFFRCRGPLGKGCAPLPGFRPVSAPRQPH
jgi:hypothetical protein